jgi:hypothetical protein
VRRRRGHHRPEAATTLSRDALGYGMDNRANTERRP